MDRISIVSALILLVTMLCGCYSQHNRGMGEGSGNGFNAQSVAIHDDASSYTLRFGDTLYSVARDHDTTVKILMQLNPRVTPTALQVGSELRIPAGKIPVRAIRKKTPR